MTKPKDIALRNVKVPLIALAVRLVNAEAVERNAILELAPPVNFAKEMSALKVVELIPIAATTCLVSKANVKILVLKLNVEKKHFVVLRIIEPFAFVPMDLLANQRLDAFKSNARQTKTAIWIRNATQAPAKIPASSVEFVESTLSVALKIVNLFACVYLGTAAIPKLNAKRQELSRAREILAELTVIALTLRPAPSVSVKLDASEMRSEAALATMNK